MRKQEQETNFSFSSHRSQRVNQKRAKAFTSQTFHSVDLPLARLCPKGSIASIISTTNGVHHEPTWDSYYSSHYTHKVTHTSHNL